MNSPEGRIFQKFLFRKNLVALLGGKTGSISTDRLNCSLSNNLFMNWILLLHILWSTMQDMCQMYNTFSIPITVCDLGPVSFFQKCKDEKFCWPTQMIFGISYLSSCHVSKFSASELYTQGSHSRWGLELSLTIGISLYMIFLMFEMILLKSLPQDGVHHNMLEVSQSVSQSVSPRVYPLQGMKPFPVTRMAL